MLALFLRHATLITNFHGLPQPFTRWKGRENNSEVYFPLDKARDVCMFLRISVCGTSLVQIRTSSISPVNVFAPNFPMKSESVFETGGLLKSELPSGTLLM